MVDELIDILKEAKIRYPIGTKFRSAYNPSRVGMVKNKHFYIQGANIFAKSSYGEAVFYNGTWAEIISTPEIKIKIKRNKILKLKYFI